MVFLKALPFLFVAEIFLLAAVIGEIGFFTTLGLWLLTVMVGGWLVNGQGLSMLGRAQMSLERGILPVGEMFAGLCLFAAGALLILPGFLSDIIAFAILVPGLRNALRPYAAKKFGLKEGSTIHGDTVIIEGVYERVPDKNEPIDYKKLDG